MINNKLFKSIIEFNDCLIFCVIFFAIINEKLFQLNSLFIIDSCRFNDYFFYQLIN